MEEKKKKRTVKRTISKDVIPLNEQTWLLQPVAVTAMRHDYDVTQTKILVNIIQQMQEAIRDEWLNHKKPETQLDLFSNKEFTDKFGEGVFDPKTEIVLKMAYSECGCDPRRYNELVTALEQLATTAVYIPIKDKEGKQYTQIDNLCSVIFPNNSRGKYERHFYVKMKNSVAIKMLDIEMGVHKYLKDVVFNTKNRYVQRLYMYISSWRGKEYCTITVDQLRKMLRLENKHKRWNMFYSNVILEAQKELKEKADAGQVDMYFVPEKIYKNGKKCGEPNEIRFYLFKSEAGEIYDEIAGFKSRKSKTGDFVKEKWHIVGNDLRNVLSRITPDNIERVNSYLTSLETIVKKHVNEGLTADKLHIYAYRCIMNELDKWDNESKMEELCQTVRVQYSPETEEESFVSSLSSEDMENWMKVLKELKEFISEENFNTWITPIVPHSISQDGILKLEVPNSTFYDLIKANYESAYLPVIIKVFGMNIRVQYIKGSSDSTQRWMDFLQNKL